MIASQDVIVIGGGIAGLTAAAPCSPRKSSVSPCSGASPTGWMRWHRSGEDRGSLMSAPPRSQALEPEAAMRASSVIWACRSPLQSILDPRLRGGSRRWLGSDPPVARPERWPRNGCVNFLVQNGSGPSVHGCTATTGRLQNSDPVLPVRSGWDLQRTSASRRTRHPGHRPVTA